MATKTTIEMAREAAGDDWGLFQEYMPEIHRFAELVRADERAQRTWVGLTDEEIKHMLELFVIPPHHVEMVVQAIEAKLKEKNQ